MKLFLTQIYCLLLDVLIKIKVEHTYHSNENISGTILWVLSFVFDEMLVKYRYHQNKNISGET